MTKERQKQYESCYMNMAIIIANLSHAVRKKVGAIIVNSEGNIIACGHNGQPTGFPNECEDEFGNTLSSTIHSELNAILKAARSGAKIEGSTLYVTMSTCSNCALLVIQSGIRKVVYLEEYRDITGITILQQAGIIVEKFIL